MEGDARVSEGRVVKAISGFFYVHDNGVTRRCRARGVFKKQGTSVLVGDFVTYEPIGRHEGVVVAVAPRHSELIRPPIANVDHALVVFSFVTPDLSLYMLDKTLVAVAVADVDVSIVLTKSDLVEPSTVEGICALYRRCGFVTLPVSSKTKDNIESVRHVMHGKINVFAGPSGAGKSSLANTMLPGMELQMGAVSEKIGRGKQTTRHVELFALDDGVTWVADAPGFSQLQIRTGSRDLTNFFPDFRLNGVSSCAYRGCSHIEEEDCAVKEAVGTGHIAKSRYQSYEHIYKEIKGQEESMY